jgi:sugar phosphate isomerase/epimerase
MRGIRRLNGWIGTREGARFVHLKDMEYRKTKRMTEVGNGIIDMGAIMDRARKAGVKWLFVEQDECMRPPLQSVEISLRNLKGNKWL